MPISKKLALSEDQLEELMTSSWNMRIATIGPGHHINLTPMWFGWAGGHVYTYGRGQKVLNLRRNSECSIIVDRNELFPELQAATFQGDAFVLEDETAEEADEYLVEARKQMGVKYNGGHGGPVSENPKPNQSTASGTTNRWIVFKPRKMVSWDNFKLKELMKKKEK